MLPALMLLLAMLRPPDMAGATTHYEGPLFDWKQTASGELYNPKGMTCAVNLQEWQGGLTCGYGRGECARAWVCGDRGCGLLRLTDTGAFSHPLDCSPAIFELICGDLDIGVCQIRAWVLPGAD